MESIIIIVMLVCGQPDTVIVKYPDQIAKYTHNLKNHNVITNITKILNEKHILIEYEDDRGVCA